MKKNNLKKLIDEYNSELQGRIDFLNKLKNEKLDKAPQEHISFQDFQNFVEEERASHLFVEGPTNIFMDASAWNSLDNAYHNLDAEQNPYAALPLETVFHLFSFLSPKSRASLACVSKKLNEQMNAYPVPKKRNYNQLVSAKEISLTGIKSIVPLKSSNDFLVIFTNGSVNTHDGHTGLIKWSSSDKHRPISPLVNGNLISYNGPSRLNILSGKDGTKISAIELPSSQNVSSLLGLADGNIACGFSNGKVIIFDANGKMQCESPQINSEEITSMGELSNGNLIIVNDKGNIYLWDLKTFEEKILYAATSNKTTTTVLMLDDNQFLSFTQPFFNDRYQAYLWNGETGHFQLIHELSFKGVSCAKLIDDIFTVSQNQFLYTLDLHTKEKKFCSFDKPSDSGYTPGRPNIVIQLNSGNILFCRRGGWPDFKDLISIYQFDYSQTLDKSSGPKEGLESRRLAKR